MSVPEIHAQLSAVPSRCEGLRGERSGKGKEGISALLLDNIKIRFGVYACSPEDSSFTAVFTDMRMTECAWKAHNGQQPDAE